jgi:hypothetical protein
MGRGSPQVQPLARRPDPLPGVDVVDPQPLRGGGAEHRRRLLGAGRVQVAALHNRNPQRVQQAEACRLHAQGVGFHRRDQRRAVHVALHPPRLPHVFHRVDPSDHRRRNERQLRRLAGEALAVGHRQEVRPQAFDLRQQPRLAGGGKPEHSHNRSHPDRDPQRGQPRTHPPRAKPHARHPPEISEPQPAGGEAHRLGVEAPRRGDWAPGRRHQERPVATFTSANATGLARPTLALTT